MVGQPDSFSASEVTAISQILSSTPDSPADLRRRSVAAILASGIQRLHDAAVESVDSSANDEPVLRNLANCLPERLDAVRPGGLSVTGVSETTGFETIRETEEIEVNDER